MAAYSANPARVHEIDQVLCRAEQVLCRLEQHFVNSKAFDAKALSHIVAKLQLRGLVTSEQARWFVAAPQQATQFAWPESVTHSLGTPPLELEADEALAFYSSLCSPSPAKRRSRPLRESAWPAPNEPTRQDFITATKRELATTAREDDVWQEAVDLRLSKEDVIDAMERELAVMAESPVLA
mmetsp:Transcript_17064/g.54597  ORF Transcript_17064/g.54597 Transcript_17064/m.54597 type:complete len:182 (-) Transcript_17064:170-715(-)